MGIQKRLIRTSPRRGRGDYSSKNHWFEIKEEDAGSMFYLVRHLEDFEKDKAIREGLKKAGNVFKTGGKRRLRERMESGRTGVTGNLLRSFHVRTKRRKLGVLVGFKHGAGGGAHAHLIDRGTEHRYQITKGRKSVGSVSPNTFWTDTEAGDYPAAMDKLYEGLERAANRIFSRRWAQTINSR